MVRDAARVLVMSLSILAVVGLAGCAKRPGFSQASAPAPGGTTVSAVPGSAPAPRGAGGSGRAEAASPSGPGSAGGLAGGAAGQVPRPSPRDFEVSANLRTIHFDFDRADIRPSDAAILEANARWLNANPRQVILIEGHCDERGTNEYNLALGERRAQATKNYLLSRGVLANRITLISYGEERPVCRTQDESCWSQNRRAQFLMKTE